jgi:hypothetical protein
MSDINLYDNTVKLAFNEGDHKYLVSHLIGRPVDRGNPGDWCIYLLRGDG